jgi:hypothetical protein
MGQAFAGGANCVNDRLGGRGPAGFYKAAAQRANHVAVAFF